MLAGNMCRGVVDDMLMPRLGNEGAAAALAEPHTKPMDFTGKPLKSMIYVAPQGIAALEDLIHWVNRGADFAATLPPKQAMELQRAYPFESAASTGLPALIVTAPTRGPANRWRPPAGRTPQAARISASPGISKPSLSNAPSRLDFSAADSSTNGGRTRSHSA